MVPEDSFLRLLLEDADVDAFDALVERARAAGASAERLAHLERERAVGLRLRELLARHRRNEAELQLLNDTANDLASMRDLDSILRAISDRARRLLDCDLAYISLSDRDRGDCYIKAASGNISGLLHELRLPRGTGVGGMVARTGEPYSVPSYMEDESIIRTPEIDRTVIAERIDSLVGVPLKIKQEVIGVLLAAHRGMRAFSGHDISALAMLGAHAAVAIENARLLTASRSAVEDLRVANATIGSHIKDLERAADVHERLTKLVLQGRGVDDVAQATADVLPGEVVVVNEHGGVVTATGAVTATDAQELAAVSARARASGHTLVQDGRCAVPLITESEDLGAVVLLGQTPIGDTDRRILERAALAASLVLVTRRRVAEAQARVGGELLAELLASEPHDLDLLQHRARMLGVDLDACRTMIVAQTDGAFHEGVHTMTAALARRRRGLATHHQGAVVLLLPGEDAAAVAHAAVRELARACHHPVTAGTARATHVTRIAAAHAEAARCMRTLLALGRVGDIADARDLGFVGTLFNGRPDVPSFVRATIGPVMDYDRAHRSELLHTLEVFCANNQNTRNTAQILHLHANTVTQRLNRITRLLGETWRQADHLLEIQIALRLLKVSRQETPR
ncbi:helix-turn-helix domain-containing protein [Actinomadura kijaniata]|uniref:helix-turn-helix domain-containing protein n=1 Tax=Actinomadura kijaniata TaxID=46161 RepID=UPI000B071186|nr:GAF domain-containing protein [Actinomadura kijaniata]